MKRRSGEAPINHLAMRRGWILGLVLGFMLGLWVKETSLRTEAVGNGHAIWMVNTHGTVEFKWLPPCGEKE